MAHEREASAERIILFSDGVLAIAITLLILPLTEIHPPAEHATLADIVVENSAELAAFALSFAVIANYWTIHHDLFRPLQRHDGRVVVLTMFWLAAIVFLPFPTALIADGIDGGFAALYIGTLLVVSVLSLLIANYLARHPELTDGEAAVEGRQRVVASAFSVAAILVALIISLFSPIIGLFGLLLLIPAQVIARRVSGAGKVNA
jgi:TMEM175 potassium channel family protein